MKIVNINGTCRFPIPVGYKVRQVAETIGDQTSTAGWAVPEIANLYLAMISEKPILGTFRNGPTYLIMHGADSVGMICLSKDGCCPEWMVEIMFVLPEHRGTGVAAAALAIVASANPGLRMQHPISKAGMALGSKVGILPNRPLTKSQERRCERDLAELRTAAKTLQKV